MQTLFSAGFRNILRLVDNDFGHKGRNNLHISKELYDSSIIKMSESLQDP